MLCAWCKEDQSEEAFLKKRGKGLSPRCLSCREKDMAKVKNWQRLNPHKQREYNLRYNRGMSLEEYDVLLIKQQGKCAICAAPAEGRNLAVDHCHTSNRVRGLLCLSCNTGIGQFKDDINLLKTAIAYLGG